MKKNDSLVEYFTKKKSQIIKSFILIILFLSSVVILNNNYSDNPFIAKLYLEGMISNETNLLEKIDQLKEKFPLEFYWENTWYSVGFGNRKPRRSLCLFGQIPTGSHHFSFQLSSLLFNLQIFNFIYHHQFIY